MDEEIFIKLRYCFAGGYTMPQYCIDNGIKKPLFVLEEKFGAFFREITAQFHYDKRIAAQYCFIDGDKNFAIDTARQALGVPIKVKHISQKKISYFDKIILLTNKIINECADKSKIIHFAELESFFIKRTYVDIPLLNFLRLNPKVKLFLTNFPSNIKRYKDGDKFNSLLLDAEELVRLLNEKENDLVKTPFDKFGYSKKEILALLKRDKAKENIDGTSSIIDDENPLINVKNGDRLTAYQPEHYLNKIYFFGPCHFFGRNAPFDKTIESYLQKMLNDNNLPYRVENKGQAFVGRGQDVFYNLNSLSFNPGDIIFFHTFHGHSNNDVIPFFDISDAFDPPHDYREIFCTKSHVNELGYKIVAEKYFKFLTENNFFRDVELKYSTPPPNSSQIWYTATIRARRLKEFFQPRTRHLQTKTAG